MAKLYILLSRACPACQGFKSMYLNETLAMLRTNNIEHQLIDVSPGADSSGINLATNLIVRAGQSPTSFGIPAFILDDQNGTIYTRNGVQTPAQLLQWLKQCLRGTSESSYFLSPMSLYPPR